MQVQVQPVLLHYGKLITQNGPWEQMDRQEAICLFYSQTKLFQSQWKVGESSKAVLTTNLRNGIPKKWGLVEIQLWRKATFAPTQFWTQWSTNQMVAFSRQKRFLYQLPSFIMRLLRYCYIILSWITWSIDPSIVDTVSNSLRFQAGFFSLPYLEMLGLRLGPYACA